MKLSLGLILLTLSVCLADDTKRDADKEKSKTKTEQRENSVERVGKDTGEAVAHGSKKAASATVKGAKWLARPWSKSKDGTAPQSDDKKKKPETKSSEKK